MKSIRIVALASAALSGLAVLAPLQAADLYAPPPPAPVAPVVPVMNWTGFYIGAGGGGNFLFADSYTAVDFFGGKPLPLQSSDHDFFPDVKTSGDLSAVGGFGTVQGGFDWQFGDRFVAGIFGNYDFGGKTSASHSASAAPIYDRLYLESEHHNEIRARVTLEDSWAVGGRLGFLSSDSTLWYGLVGYTQAKIEGEAGYERGGLVAYSDHGGDYQYSWSDWQDGLVVGAGVETLLTDVISLKMEYRYTNYESFGGYDGDAEYYGVEQVAEFDPEVHSIRGVVSWRFGNLF